MLPTSVTLKLIFFVLSKKVTNASNRMRNGASADSV